ncbi:ABC transporter permease [Humibacter ginsenosidimutans]|uniref:ABC transporter permease subunit n=1 Tax=Humibacter ginsenosidimutans TaxID=2599293 RepID=A0A5B8M5I5_9MICO|nr:ABC transporter permease subunit [Humibacter ginsenosidimutans]QDZ15461.1 ABC transporter permease subunit [Humibacter ginsenosidimutans]
MSAMTHGDGGAHAAARARGSVAGASWMLARKEAFEIVRTWRVIVLPAIVLLFAVTSPLLAKYTPDIVTALAGSQFSGLKLPEPTVYDAYGQWIKNLSQIAAFAIIIIYGGIVSAERKSGTAVLVLTKPVSRVAFVVVKFVVQLVYLAVIVAVGCLVTWAVTAVTFGDAVHGTAGALWASTWVWFVLAALYLAVMVLFSVLIPAAAGAAGAGLGVYVVLAVASAWQKVGDWSPAGLISGSASLAANTQTESMLWPVLITVAAIVVAVGVAALVFRRQEL